MPRALQEGDFVRDREYAGIYGEYGIVVSEGNELYVRWMWADKRGTRDPDDHPDDPTWSGQQSLNSMNREWSTNRLKRVTHPKLIQRLTMAYVRALTAGQVQS